MTPIQVLYARSEASLNGEEAEAKDSRILVRAESEVRKDVLRRADQDDEIYMRGEDHLRIHWAGRERCCTEVWFEAWTNPHGGGELGSYKCMTNELFSQMVTQNTCIVDEDLLNIMN